VFLYGMSTRYVVLPLLIFILIISLALSALGCDRLVNISGIVYQWVNPPARAASLIFHKEISPAGIRKDDLPEGLELRPLKDVKISAYGLFKTETFYSNEITDAEGHYRLMISLGQKTDSYDTTVEAVCPGYMSVKRKITDVGDSHWVTIILAPEGNNPEEPAPETAPPSE
jgi:hypothetical protein